MGVIHLSSVDLGLAACLVLLLALASRALGLGLEGRLLVSALRTTVQLLLMGLVLHLVFGASHPLVLALMAMVMLGVAGREVLARQGRPLRGLAGYGIGTLSMFVSSFTVTCIALACIIGAEPWYRPQYAIPLLGMLLGNTMNGVALGTDRLTSSMHRERAVIEQRMLLGMSAARATARLRREAMRAGMIPIINAMAAAGIVSLPGMMTGQILGGTAPVEAVRYQILIMFLIATGTGFGVMCAIHLTCARLFDSRERLRLDLLGKGR